MRWCRHKRWCSVAGDGCRTRDGIAVSGGTVRRQPPSWRRRCPPAACPRALRSWRLVRATRDLAALLAAGRRTLYCGFDPTTPSLQLGNLMPIMLLRHFQLAGHRPIVLMGGGTGLIGDPSGKRSERPLLSREQIRENLQRMRDQMARLLDFDG